VISCAVERCCICHLGQATCSDSDTAAALCLYPGEHMEIAAAGTAAGAPAFSCWSAGGAGIGEAVRVKCRK
jgi:hypothetical protein